MLFSKTTKKKCCWLFVFVILIFISLSLYISITRSLSPHLSLLQSIKFYLFIVMNALVCLVQSFAKASVILDMIILDSINAIIRIELIHKFIVVWETSQKIRRHLEYQPWKYLCCSEGYLELQRSFATKNILILFHFGNIWYVCLGNFPQVPSRKLKPLLQNCKIKGGVVCACIA